MNAYLQARLGVIHSNGPLLLKRGENDDMEMGCPDVSWGNWGYPLRSAGRPLWVVQHVEADAGSAGGTRRKESREGARPVPGAPPLGRGSFGGGYAASKVNRRGGREREAGRAGLVNRPSLHKRFCAPYAQDETYPQLPQTYGYSEAGSARPSPRLFHRGNGYLPGPSSPPRSGRRLRGLTSRVGGGYTALSFAVP